MKLATLTVLAIAAFLALRYRAAYRTAASSQWNDYRSIDEYPAGGEGGLGMVNSKDLQVATESGRLLLAELEAHLGVRGEDAHWRLRVAVAEREAADKARTALLASLQQAVDAANDVAKDRPIAPGGQEWVCLPPWAWNGIVDALLDAAASQVGTQHEGPQAEEERG